VIEQQSLARPGSITLVQLQLDRKRLAAVTSEAVRRLALNSGLNGPNQLDRDLNSFLVGQGTFAQHLISG
jgi:hypothetical protein